MEQSHVDKTMFHLSQSNCRRNLSVDEVCSNLCTLASCYQQVDLVISRIRHRWNMGGSEHWYLGAILDIVPCTDDWYNVKYDDEEQILSLNVKVDIDKGDLEFV